MEYKVGDRVCLSIDIPHPNQHFDPISKGEQGTICRIAGTGRLGISFDNYLGGHDCNSACKDGTGLYLDNSIIYKIPRTSEEEFKELMELL